MNVVQEHYASNEGLTRMHMDLAVTIEGGIMHLKVACWSNSGDQDRCTGGRARLNWAINYAPSTMNVVQSTTQATRDLPGCIWITQCQLMEASCTLRSPAGRTQVIRTGARVDERA